jgi:hypothetical protein
MKMLHDHDQRKRRNTPVPNEDDKYMRGWGLDNARPGIPLLERLKICTRPAGPHEWVSRLAGKPDAFVIIKVQSNLANITWDSPKQAY